MSNVIHANFQQSKSEENGQDEAHEGQEYVATVLESGVVMMVEADDVSLCLVMDALADVSVRQEFPTPAYAVLH